jgi:hypothetical protein
VFPYLKFNNEASRLSEILLTWIEMGRFGDVSDFKKTRTRRSGYAGRVVGEDSKFVR